MCLEGLLLSSDQSGHAKTDSALRVHSFAKSISSHVYTYTYTCIRIHTYIHAYPHFLPATFGIVTRSHAHIHIRTQPYNKHKDIHTYVTVYTQTNAVHVVASMSRKMSHKKHPRIQKKKHGHIIILTDYEAPYPWCGSVLTKKTRPHNHHH